MTTLTVDRPGIYEIPELDYHTGTATKALGRSLSVSGAKTLLKNPARFAWERDHKHPATDAMDAGSVCHELILHGGDGRIRVADAYDWKSPKIRDQRDTWRAAGLVAIHRGQLREAARMRQAVMRDPLIAGIFSQGVPERSMYWVDEATGVLCRGRLDWLRPNALVDLKTTFYGGTDDEALAKTAASMDWPMQAAHYSDGYEALTGQRLPFLYVVIEREAPYLARVVQLSDTDMHTGREKVRTALERFAEYEATGYPGTTTDIETLNLPAWYGR